MASKFCTCHNSTVVMPCAKFYSDLITMTWKRREWISIKFELWWKHHWNAPWKKSVWQCQFYILVPVYYGIFYSKIAERFWLYEQFTQINTTKFSSTYQGLNKMAENLQMTFQIISLKGNLCCKSYWSFFPEGSLSNESALFEVITCDHRKHWQPEALTYTLKPLI